MSNISIFKETCLLCFTTSQHAGGVLTCAAAGFGFCADHLALYKALSGNQLFVRHFKTRHVAKVEPKAVVDGQSPQPKKLAIGTDDAAFALDAEQVTYESKYSIVTAGGEMDCDTFMAKNPQFAEAVNRVVASMDALHRAAVSADAAAWAGDERKETNHKNLTQITNPPVVVLSKAVCEHAGCGLTENLWLNLSDGSVFCGRKQYISADIMMMGNNHALEHFHASGNPLVCKIGTITPNGADVFSYDEDENVIDPSLEQHLKHFGINMRHLSKTEQTTEELELSWNQQHVFDAVTEAGTDLQPLYGKGHVGLVNLGNSCYIASVLQLLSAVPELMSYYASVDLPSTTQQITALQQSLLWQMRRVFAALNDAKYSQESESVRHLNGLRPLQLRQVIGQKNAQFNNKQQQDAEEFIRFLVDDMDKTKSTPSPASLFKFLSVTQVEQEPFVLTPEVILSVGVPEQICTVTQVDIDGKQQTVRSASMLTALQHTFEDFLDVQGRRRVASISAMPKYLLVQVKRFTFQDGQPAKMEVEMTDVQQLDLSQFINKDAPKQVPVSVAEASSAAASAAGDTESVALLTTMGMDHALAVRALNTFNNPEHAINWFFDGADESLLKDANAAAAEEFSGRLSEVVSDPVNGKYELCAFVSHLGSNAACGHYVAHVLKQGVWTIFNDEKVAKSVKTPFAHGYVYLYKQA